MPVLANQRECGAEEGGKVRRGVRRKRMTEAITPTLKPTPLETWVRRSAVEDICRGRWDVRLHDEVGH